MGGPSSQQRPPRLPLPDWPTLRLEAPSPTLPATPMLPTTLMLTESPELWSVTLTELWCQSTLLRSTLPRLLTLLPEAPSTLLEPTLPTTPTPTLDSSVTPTELSFQWSPLMSRPPEPSTLLPTPVLKRTN